LEDDPILKLLDEISEEDPEVDSDGEDIIEPLVTVTEAERIDSYGDIVKDLSIVGLSDLRLLLIGEEVQGSLKFTKALDNFANQKGFFSLYGLSSLNLSDSFPLVLDLSIESLKKEDVQRSPLDVDGIATLGFTFDVVILTALSELQESVAIDLDSGKCTL
jgi:hypothetical protein